ncbi:unnamed protein product [Camellia sinensis]
MDGGGGGGGGGDKGIRSKSSAVTANGNEEEEPVNDINKRSWDQREALSGEPRCVVCGHYGEYICDETDDIFSLECKQTLLCRIANSRLPVGLLHPTRLLPTTTTSDECFYVRDSDEKSKSESESESQFLTMEDGGGGGGGDKGIRSKSLAVTANGNDEEEPVNDINKKSWEQREALPGEPHCVVCGHYGEYICDETDDIFILECKQTLLCRIANSRLPVGLLYPTRLLPTTTTSDECFYVRDSDEKSKSESESQFLTNHPSELLRRKLKINVRGDFVPTPILSFASCNLPHKLLQNIEAAGYEMPTPVQNTSCFGWQKPACFSRHWFRENCFIFGS